MTARGVGWFSFLMIACGGGAATPPDHATSTHDAPVAAKVSLSDAERAACAHKDGADVDSLACLVAERGRLDAGDAAGAKAVVAYGCEQGDIDACHELRALEPTRAAELDAKIVAACGAMGDLGKKLAACVRGHTTDVMSTKEIPATLPYELGIELRARYAPAILAQLPALESGCRASIGGPTIPTFAGTPIARDSSILDAAVDCSGIDVSKAFGKGEHMAVGTDFVVRSLHDALLSDSSTLRVSAAAGPAVAGVYCPSLLVDADDAADVWVRSEKDGVTTLAITTVHIDQPCWNADARPGRAKERSVLDGVFAPVAQVVDAALAKLADRCDAPPTTLDTKMAPLAGDAIEHTPHVVSFEPACVFGFRSMTLATSKPLNHPNPMTSDHEYARVGGRSARIEAIQHRPGILEFTVRRRNAELVVGVKK